MMFNQKTICAPPRFVNYGDGLVPLDKLFGTWHDGSPEAEARMNVRYERRKARLNAAKAAS